MNGGDMLDIAREAVLTLLIVSGPVMGVGLFVGLLIALFQALTQIQEITLTFIPKIVATFLSLLVFLPLMGQQMGDLMTLLIDRVATGG